MDDLLRFTPKDVKHYRKVLKITQRELAILLRVTLRAVENYEQPEGRVNHRKFPEEFARMLLRWERDGVPIH